jgi:hypothetical protein
VAVILLGSRSRIHVDTVPRLTMAIWVSRSAVCRLPSAARTWRPAHTLAAGPHPAAEVSHITRRGHQVQVSRIAFLSRSTVAAPALRPPSTTLYVTI